MAPVFRSRGGERPAGGGGDGPVGRDEPWLVVGLGNPGTSYANNRHNVGAMVLDELAARVRAKLKSHKGRADVAEGRRCGQRAILARPRSYMNESGGAVAGLRAFFRIA